MFKAIKSKVIKNNKKSTSKAKKAKSDDSYGQVTRDPNGVYVSVSSFFDGGGSSGGSCGGGGGDWLHDGLIQIQAKASCAQFLTDSECRQALIAVYEEVQKLINKEQNE